MQANSSIKGNSSERAHRAKRAQQKVELASPPVPIVVAVERSRLMKEFGAQRPDERKERRVLLKDLVARNGQSVGLDFFHHGDAIDLQSMDEPQIATMPASVRRLVHY
jgi:hypothetical protein